MNEHVRGHALRRPCECKCELGYIKEVNGQDTVRCVKCGTFQYNAPRTETGREVRSVRTREAIKPGQRSRILDRANRRCEVCGATGRLHVGHILSVKAGDAYGVSREELDHDENLIAECEECNLGRGPLPMPLRTALAILRARIAWGQR